MSIVISSWIYIAPKGHTSLHHQVGKDIGTQHVQNYYWRSLVCLMGSAAAVCPEARRIAFLNVDVTSLPSVDGADLRLLFADLGVELVVLESVTLPPQGYFGAWGTQFVVLDCMEKLVTLCKSEDQILLLDSDCVINLPLEGALQKAICEHRILRFTLSDGRDEPINGLSCQQLAELAREYDPPLNKASISYAGGEIIGATHHALTEAAQLARSAYRQSLERFSKGLPKFNEEAHLLSYVYEVMDIKDRTANGFIKRIWTDRGLCCNVDGRENLIAIWHLPAEKKRGFVDAYKELIGNRSLFKNRDRMEVIFNLKPSPLALLKMHTFGAIRPLYHRFRKLWQ